MERTPPPPQRLHTPPAPHHGPKHDSYEPYSPRRSSRVAAQRELTERQQQQNARSGLLRGVRDVTPSSSRKIPAARTSLQGLSPPSSPISPDYHGSRKSTKRALFGDRTSDSDSERERFAPTPARRFLSAMEPRGMLPTPAKTPSKRHLQTEESLGQTARVLFQDRPATIEEAMPTPRKGRKAKIAIFTDSKERVPVADEEDDNPFVTRNGKGKAKAAPKIPAKPRKLDPEFAEMQEAVARDEGSIYTFRGKKIFRKYEDVSAPPDDEPGRPKGKYDRAIGPAIERPLTRSSIKPRLLFQDEIRQQQLEREAEEEAITDIEAPVATPSNRKNRRTNGIEVHVEQETTPPPSNQRPKRREISFDSWSRVKSSSSREDNKRKGSPLESSSGKRLRNTPSASSEPSSAMSIDQF